MHTYIGQNKAEKMCPITMGAAFIAGISMATDNPGLQSTLPYLLVIYIHIYLICTYIYVQNW